MDVNEENNMLIVSVSMFVSFYDYVMNVDTSEVIRGKKEQMHYNLYDLEFIKSRVVDNNVCPNCGGMIKNQECENCHSVVENGYTHFVLNKKSIRK